MPKLYKWLQLLTRALSLFSFYFIDTSTYNCTDDVPNRILYRVSYNLLPKLYSNTGSVSSFLVYCPVSIDCISSIFISSFCRTLAPTLSPSFSPTLSPTISPVSFDFHLSASPSHGFISNTIFLTLLYRHLVLP